MWKKFKEPRPCLALAALIAAAASLLMPLALRAQGDAPSLVLAAAQKANFPIVVAHGASSGTRSAAAKLADYLQRISGARFQVVEGDGQSGIAVGTVADFPALSGFPGHFFDYKNPDSSQDYLLQSTKSGVYLIGATDAAVGYAVWDFLYRLGYRQFFPGADWEVIPSLDTVTASMYVHGHPSFQTRSIFYGGGAAEYSQAPFADWQEKNRLPGAYLDVGHQYETLIANQKATFAAHADFTCNVPAMPQKFCLANPELRKAVASYALEYFRTHPSAQSLSMSPSDGGGWCDCSRVPGAANLSDSVITLANEVAAAVRAQYKGKKIGVYAYADYFRPPTITVDPDVVVLVTSADTLALTKAGGSLKTNGDVRALSHMLSSLDSSALGVIEGWKRQGATIGIRDYLGVYRWDWGLPGQSRVSSLQYLRTAIPRFYSMGARYFVAEATDSWGQSGLGMYLLSRELWDVGEAQNIDALTDDFLEKSFGPAKATMSDYYRLIDGSSSPALDRSLTDRLFALLSKAKSMTNDHKIQARINDLVLYTQYVEAYDDYDAAQGPDRGQKAQAMLRSTYRMKSSLMVDAHMAVPSISDHDKTLGLPQGSSWSSLKGTDPGKWDKAYSDQEVQDLLTKKAGPH